MAVLAAAAAGTRTVDLEATATTTDVADEVIARVKALRDH
jgi:isocitrate/isopropylmalate dehydrogenase